MNEVTKYENGGAVGRPIDIESLFRAAIERGPEGVEAMERLVAVRRELNAEAAKRAFDDALAAFQAECPVVSKGRKVILDGKVAYGYAPFETILATVRDCLHKHGFSFTLDTDTASQDGWVIAKCEVTHAAGHSRVSVAKFPLGSGTRLMSATQVYAAALSFASRRVFCNAFGIVTSGEDLDGAGPKPTPLGPSKARDEAGKPTDPLHEAKRRLWELLKRVRGDQKDWLTAEGWLESHKIIGKGQTVSALTFDQLAETFDKASIVLAEGN